MLKQLKAIFPSLQIHSTYSQVKEKENWYATKEGNFISISKKEMSSKDEVLLATFLQAVDEIFPQQTETEKLWEKRIFEEITEGPKKSITPFRFIYFQIEQGTVEPTVFKEAIVEIFSQDIPILWNKTWEGVLIEEKNGELIDYTQIIDVLMSDLYVNIKFFVGEPKDDFIQLKDYYNSIVRNAKLGFTFVKKNVFSFVDIIPHMLMQALSPSTKEELKNAVLKDYQEDPETLKMLETFIHCNLNLSSAAKQLYLHRNSLQYRIDKFIEHTNIDIKNFHHALAVYFALLATRKK